MSGLPRFAGRTIYLGPLVVTGQKANQEKRSIRYHCHKEAMTGTSILLRVLSIPSDRKIGIFYAR